jgi:hypothetical protein
LNSTSSSSSSRQEHTVQDIPSKLVAAASMHTVEVNVTPLPSWAGAPRQATLHVLCCSCRYNLRVRLYRPRSASLLQSFTSWMSGMPAEFSDPKFPSYGEGREGEQQRTPAVHRTLVTAWRAAGCSALGGSATSSADASWY